MALGALVEGEWKTARDQEDGEGKFVRPSTTFRDWITAEGGRFPAAAGRYHLYVSLACPWAHRTLIMRQLKGLTEAIGVSIVHPEMAEEGWEFKPFPGSTADRVNGVDYLRQIYLKAEPQFTGRVTVPILWDKQTQTIVNNESREIIRMLDQAFGAILLGRGSANAQSSRDLYPADLQSQIDQAIDAIYQPINNGVYRAGFATQQSAYDEAVTELFQALDHWEEVLSQQRYLCGDRLTEADICMFTTLFRFDAVYYVHFKCNLRRIVDYPNLWNYLKDLYQTDDIRSTCNLEHIKTHYYRSHPHVNPTRIVPKGPVIDFDTVHDRDRF